MPDYGSKFDLIVAYLDAIKGQAEALGTDQAGIASKIAGVTNAINDLVDEVNSGNTSAAGHRTGQREGDQSQKTDSHPLLHTVSGLPVLLSNMKNQVASDKIIEDRSIFQGH